MSLIFPKQAELARPKQHPLLEPWSLGAGVTVPDRVLPAPMEGILTPLFCQCLTREKRVSLWVTPYVRLSAELPRQRKLLRMVEHFFETKLPVVVQLMGTHEEVLAEAAYRFVEAGAVGINFNFACPSKTVLKHGSGGGFLKQPKRMVSMVEAAARQAPGIPISVKMRTGYSSPMECVEVLKALYQSSCSMVAVHHRTVEESYKHVSGRVERWLRARQHWPDRDFIVSGDMFSVEDVLSLPPDFTGVMVARGLIKRPLLINEIKAALSGLEVKTDAPLNEDVALDFLEHLATICLEDPERYWSSKYMLEICRHTLGRRSWLFEKMVETFRQKDLPYATEMLELCSRYREEKKSC